MKFGELSFSCHLCRQPVGLVKAERKITLPNSTCTGFALTSTRHAVGGEDSVICSGSGTIAGLHSESPNAATMHLIVPIACRPIPKGTRYEFPPPRAPMAKPLTHIPLDVE